MQAHTGFSAVSADPALYLIALVSCRQSWHSVTGMSCLGHVLYCRPAYSAITPFLGGMARSLADTSSCLNIFILQVPCAGLAPEPYSLTWTSYFPVVVWTIFWSQAHRAPCFAVLLPPQAELSCVLCLQRRRAAASG